MMLVYNCYQGYEELDAKTYASWGVDCERNTAVACERASL